MADAPRTDPEARTEVAPLLGTGPGQLTSSPEASPPLVAGRYEILGMLGSGGMGTVYRARDRELEETVALKIVRKELAASPGMLERFKREVKLARLVTHKNVARTYDIGEHEGDRFLTMELVDGEMLGMHLARRGRVPLRDVVNIGRDVCAGLAAAHAAGVLHRDLKPENVIIARDGRAVITDFGIARALTQGDLGRTGGGLVGTPAYMAPEQVEGSRDLDGRADLYALGAMLYELLSGKPAWDGDSAFAVAAARLLRPPPDVRTVAPGMPDAAAEVILKLMARAPADRFASADEAGEAIAALSTEGAPSNRSLLPDSMTTRVAREHAKRKTVAILPLLNVGEKDDQYLADTCTEDLVDLLSVIPELRVRPRGETARYDRPSRDVREAGRALGVDVVVDGSVRRIGEVVRVTVRLVAVEDGFQLWAHRFDRAPAQVLTVADDAAAAIARALTAELTAEARPVVADAVAQDLYLRGRYALHRGWFEVSQAGMKMLREAHQLAPDDLRIAATYALALARVLTSDPKATSMSAEARTLAEKVLVAVPSSTEARLALAFLHLNDSETKAAAVQLKRALDVNPNCVDAQDLAGRLLAEVDDTGFGIEALRRALAMDPSLAHARHTLVRAYALLGDYEAAVEATGAWSSHPGDFTAQMLARARIALWRGKRDAIAELRAELDRHQLSAVATRSVAGILDIAYSGQVTPDFVAEMEGLLAIDGRYPPRRTCFNAQLRVEMKLAAGRVDDALVDLRVADINGLIDLAWLERCPLFDAARARPELAAVRDGTSSRAARVREILAPFGGRRPG